MRVVLDTNILVSALLSPGGNPARILGLTLNGKLTPLFDAAILAEYRLVLARPKFGFNQSRIAALMDYLESEGEGVSAEPCPAAFTDEADGKFYEIAITGQASALITGNIIHFPKEPLVMTPSNFLIFWTNRPE
jgi:putative PIN family toxin of toxin-antitoxin system